MTRGWVWKAAALVVTLGSLGTWVGCTLFHADYPGGCRADSDCFGAQGEICDVPTGTCIPRPDAAPLPDARIIPDAPPEPDSGPDAEPADASTIDASAIDASAIDAMM